jgi:23S rRNA (adenine1618-N6)-methyltransferase
MELATRPPYEAIDFKALAKQDKDFDSIWLKSSGSLDFQNPETTQALTRAILKVHFGLHLDVPDDRLCPPVPNRWNYVSWIHNLLDSTNPNYQCQYDPERKVIGLDIGTGASAIYAMLCLKSRPNWTMCATDVDKKSFDYAARNLSNNGLISRTKLLQTIESQPLVPLGYLSVDKLDFTICNPPFFTDEKDMRQSLNGETKSWKPNAICTGAENEMVCHGGDLGFVTRIVEESLVLREKVSWYTSMLGKMSSAKAIINFLKEKDVSNWAVGSIDVGAHTKRWIVAWSFEDYRPRNVRIKS